MYTSPLVALVVLALALTVTADIVRLEEEWNLPVRKGCADAAPGELCSKSGTVDSGTFDVGHHTYLTATDDNGVHFWRTDKGHLKRLGFFPTPCPVRLLFARGSDVVFAHDQSPACSCTAATCTGIIPGILIGGESDPVPLQEGTLSLRLANVIPNSVTVSLGTNLVTVPDTIGCAPWTTPNTNGKWVLIKRGVCSFAQKLDNAMAAAAGGMLAGVIVYNREPGTIGMSTGTPYPFPFFMVDLATGQALAAGDSGTFGATVGFPTPAVAPMGFLTFNIDAIIEEEVITSYQTSTKHLSSVMSTIFDEDTGILLTLTRDEESYRLFEVNFAVNQGGYFSSPGHFQYLGLYPLSQEVFEKFAYLYSDYTFFGREGTRYATFANFHENSLDLWSFEDVTDPQLIDSVYARSPEHVWSFKNRYTLSGEGFLNNMDPPVTAVYDWMEVFTEDAGSDHQGRLVQLISHRFCTRGAQNSAAGICGDYLWNALSSDGFSVHAIVEPLHPLLLARVDPLPDVEGSYTVGATGIHVWKNDCTRAVGVFQDVDGTNSLVGWHYAN